MLNGVHFYHATIKRVVSVFGTIFNNIRVGRHNGNNISNIARVPISYGPRQKFLARVNEKLDEQKVAIKLPRMSFEITSIDYDTSTKLNRMNTTLLPTDSNSPLKRKKQYQSVPYILGMQLNIMARNQEDALQVLEQILPTFTPEYTVTIKDIEGPGSKTDVPFILNSVSLQDDYEGDFQGRRTIVYTLDFTVKIRFAPDTSSANIIKKVETHIADFTNVSTAEAKPLSTVHVRADSPADTIQTFTTLIDPATNHTVTLYPNTIDVNGLGILNSILTASIASGGSADFDRVETEDFSTVYTRLSGTGGSGKNALFAANVNTLTGATTSVDISLAGLQFVVGDTITINDSPYDTTPLVLSVSSVDTPAGVGQSPNMSPTVGDNGSPLDQYGAITGITITSGDGANASVTSNFSPSYEREVAGTVSNNTPQIINEGEVEAPTGEGAVFNVKLNKLGAVTGFDILDGGFNYDTPNQITISGELLGEDDKEHLIEIDSPHTTGGTGRELSVSFKLQSKDGSLTDLEILDGGHMYTEGDLITIDRGLVQANSPSVNSTPAADVVLRVIETDQSPSQQFDEVEGDDTPSIVGTVSFLKFVSGDSPIHTDRVVGLWDSPYTDLVINVDTVDSIQLDGIYTRNGTLNNRPKWVMTTPDAGGANDTPTNNSLTISYDGQAWVLTRYDSPNTIVLARNYNIQDIAPPPNEWEDVAKDGTSTITFNTNDDLKFPTGSILTGNLTATTSIVVSHDSPHKLIVNNLEQSYSDGEILSMENGNITRRVFNTELT